jgi:hypothetical protein
MSELEELIEAVKRGDVENVTALVHSHPELINERDDFGATALHHAAFGGHRAVARFLVQNGAEINAPDAEFGATPGGGQLSTCVRWAAFWELSLTTLPMPSRAGMWNGSRDSSDAFPNFVVPATRAGTPSSCSPGNPEIRKS